MALTPAQTAASNKPILPSDKPYRPPANLGSINAQGQFVPSSLSLNVKTPAVDHFGSANITSVPSFSGSPTASTTKVGTVQAPIARPAPVAQPKPVAAPAQVTPQAPARPLTSSVTLASSPSISTPTQPQVDATGIQTFADGSRLDTRTGQVLPKAGQASTLPVPPPTAVQGPTPPTPSIRESVQPRTNAQLDALRQELLRGYQMSPEERAAQERLDAIMAQQGSIAASGELGQASIANQPIVMSLIRGQQEALQKQTAAQLRGLSAQAIPLEQQLMRQQQMRELDRERAKTGLGFLESDLEREQATSKPIEIGGNLVQFNPESGRYETVFQAPGQEAEGFTLGEGQARFDAQGNLIASGAPKASSQPATVQEYQFAQQNGFTGSFLDYQRAKDQATSSGSSVPNSYKEWQLAGQPGDYASWLKSTTGKAPTEAQSKAATFAARMGASLPVIDTLENKFTGLFSKVAPFEAWKSEDRKRFEQAERSFINATLRRESGAVISPDEFANARLQYIPQMGDTPAVLAQKRAERNIIKQGMEREAGAAGFSPNNHGSFSGGSGDALDQALDSLGFKKDLSKSQNGPLPKEGSRAQSSMGTGTITAYGSPLWKPGLDFVLSGGPNAPVKLPLSGTVVAASSNGGFGNQVKVRLDDGNEMWVSHLNQMNVRPGQRITPSTVIGLQGNTGSVIKSPGGTGTHLDLTMPKQGGGYYTAQDVARYIGAA